MVIGVDPAHLASELGRLDFFTEDTSEPARALSGALGGLVWDNNAPDDELLIPKIWLPSRRDYVFVRVRFLKSIALRNLDTAREYVRRAHEKGHHVICGPEDHSYLVAGSVGENEYFVGTLTAKGTSGRV